VTTPLTPGRLARALLRLGVPRESRDAIEGDLYELYVARRRASSRFATSIWYWLEVLSLTMRFAPDRFIGVMRSLASGDALPSRLDLKLGARMLAKSPGLALVGGFGMAVGVALTAGAYALFNSYFYPEIPLPEGDRIVAVGKFDALRRVENEQLLHDFTVWRRELKQVQDLGAFRTVTRNLAAESGAGEPITLAEMTATGFRVARIAPLLGRTLLDDDERFGAPPVIVIGYDVWQSRFAGDPAIVGRAIRIGRNAHTIVGVMPRGFAFPVSHQYWIPLRIDPRAPIRPGMGPNLDVFGRLAPDATRESAQAELAMIASRLTAEGPKELAHLDSRIVDYTDVFMHAEAARDSAPYALMRFLIAFLLVVVAMNVAVLVYARTATRSEEIAVRTALGATRGRIVAQLFAEAFVLSGLAALAGLGMVAVGLNMLDRFMREEGGAPFWINSGLSLGTILYALLLALLAAVIVGVVPAMRATGSRLRMAMGSLGSGARAKLGATWTTLIITQVGITVAILPPAMLKGGQTVRMAVQPQGFASGEYLSANFFAARESQVNTSEAGERAAADSVRLTITTLLARLANETGVVGATITAGVPWEGTRDPIEVEGLDAPARSIRIQWVDTSFFGLFGVPVLTGRRFAPNDGALSPDDRPVIVNSTFVTDVLGGGDAIGRRVRHRPYGDETMPWHTIVGVVEEFPRGVRSSGTPNTWTMYQLTVPGEWDGAMLTVRLRGQRPETFAPVLRQLAMSVDPMLQLSNVRSLDARYRDWARSGAQLALLVVLISGSVLLLSSAGIHALVSFTVTQRRREIGIRTALGASAGLILGSVLRRAARQLALGVGAGLLMAVLLDRLAGGELMNGIGLLLVPATAAFMLLVGLIAAAGPARRGLRVQPTEALRSE
jgi:putative ABC transport system permease protein